MSPTLLTIFLTRSQEKQDARGYYHSTGLGMTITKGAC